MITRPTELHPPQADCFKAQKTFSSRVKERRMRFWRSAQLRPTNAPNECSDRSGWQHLALNNWKPDFNIDVCCNPGGDGAVIFVGLAPPPAAQK